MTEPDSKPTLLHRVEALLADRGVDTYWGEDGLLEITGELSTGPCVGYVGVGAVTTGFEHAAARFSLLQAVWPVPVATPPGHRRGAVESLLACIAPDVALGQFELDPDTDVPRFRVTLLLPEGIEPPDAWLLAPLLEGLDLVDEYTPAFERVIDHGEAAGHVYVQKVLADAQAADLPLDDGDRQRLLRMLEAAAAAYQRAGQRVRLDLLGALVRQLADG